MGFEQSPPVVSLAVFAKWPSPGFAKTRLIPLLGELGSARVAHQLLIKTLEWTRQWRDADVSNRQVVVWTDKGLPAQWDALLAPYGFAHTPQCGADLGEKMYLTLQMQLEQAEYALIVGTDTPTLSAGHMTQVVDALTHSEVCIIPAMDGGYVLIGMRVLHRCAFTGIAWGTDQVAAVTRLHLTQANVSQTWLSAQPDLDTPEDYVRMIDAGYLPALDSEPTP